MSSRITVIIPTRHRGHTIGDTLRSCLNQCETEDYEILVSDNLSHDGTEELVTGIQDPRLRYIQTPNVLSMEGNWEFALSHVKEGYTMILGADDSLVPGAITSLKKVIHESGAEAIRPPLISYYWHNFPLEDQAQMARGVPVDDERWWWEDSQEQLKACSESLLKHQLFFDVLPTLYHGLVHIRVLNELRARNGAVFQSKIPDMYSAVLVAAALPRYARMNSPVSLNAMSCSSNAVAQWHGGHEKDADMRRFWAEVEHPYEPELVPDSATPDITLAFPVLIADQYLKVQKRGLPVPAISIEKVFEATVKVARRWREKDQYESAVRVARGMAKIHGWEAKLDEMLPRYPYQERTEKGTRQRTLYDDARKTYRYLDLRQDATGACSAGEAIVKLRAVHQQQRALPAAANGGAPSNNAESQMPSWSHSKWLLWSTIRQEANTLTGAVVVGCDEDIVLRKLLLSPPSRALSVRFGLEPTGTDETFILATGTTLAALPNPASKVLTLERSQQASTAPAPGLVMVSRVPLACTTEETLALALAAWQDDLPQYGWKRRAIELLLAPIWRLLRNRFSAESSKPPAPTGWEVACWCFKD